MSNPTTIVVVGTTRQTHSPFTSLCALRESGNVGHGPCLVHKGFTINSIKREQGCRSRRYTTHTCV